MTANGVTPMHKIEIVHSWKEIGRTSSETGSMTVVEQCQHCGTKQEVLHLGRDSGPTFRDIPETKVLDLLRSTFDRWEDFVQSIKEMFEQLVADSDYDTSDAIITDISNGSQGVVDGSNLPYRQLQLWLNKPKSYRVKNLLPYFQGQVCNRCDRIFSPIIEPTVDHINGDRSNAHPGNFQLLCKECNGHKGRNPSDKRDVSPFTYTEPPCEHRLTCVELHAMQACEEDGMIEGSSQPNSLESLTKTTPTNVDHKLQAKL